MSNDKSQQIGIIRGDEEHFLAAYTSPEVSIENTHMQELLRQSEDQYRVLFETMVQGVICQDTELHITMANPAAEQILGFSFEQLCHKKAFESCWGGVHEDGSPFSAETQPAALALHTGKVITNVVMGIYNPIESRYRWLNVSAVPQFLPGQTSPYQVYTIFYDQTSHKHRQDLLRLSEQQARARVNELETIFEVISDHVCVYDTDGKIIYINDSLREILSLDAECYHQLSLQEYAILYYLRDEDGHVLGESDWPVTRILKGEVFKNEHAIDMILRRPDGHDIQFNISGAPMHDTHGRIIGAVMLMMDVTERRLLERRTRRTLDALLAMAESLVQDIPDGDMLLKVNGREAAHPGENIVGKRLLELPRRLLDCQRVGIALLDPETDILHPVLVAGISEEHERHWYYSLQGARLKNLLGDASLTARLHRGELLSLDITLPIFRDHPSYKLISPIMNGSMLVGILLLGYGSMEPHVTKNEIDIIQAISRLASLVIHREKAQHERDQAQMELQRANEELARTNKVKSDFISIVSHEFRTALTSIQGFSEIMRDKELSPAEMREFAVDIHADARRLARMISDLLDLDRMELGRMQLSLGWLDMNAIIIDVVGRMHNSSPQHTVRLLLANALPILLGDRDKLMQVVANLLNNAIKYSPQGGEVVITSAVEGNVVHVSVRDQGVGIAASDLERIFERYARISTRSTRYIEGTGLGLPIVREIVQMHGGEVWAESTLGKGSAFHFTVQFTDSRL